MVLDLYKFSIKKLERIRVKELERIKDKENQKLGEKDIIIYEVVYKNEELEKLNLLVKILDFKYVNMSEKKKKRKKKKK